MPVSISYKGRLGNKIFQYVSARIFAEKNNLNLITNLDNDVVKFKSPINYEDDFSNNNTIHIDSKNFQNDEIPFLGKNVVYHFVDFFQNCNYINNNKELVRTFFDLPKIEVNKEDIVMHLRLDDYLHTDNIENPTDWERSEIINHTYYTNILKTEKYNKLYIVVEKLNYEWEKKYISFFDEFNPIIISQTPKEDFEFIRKFDKIITSNSTFCYWSAFLSEASKIYTFDKIGYYGRNLIKHGEHVKNLDNIKNLSISINENFYFGD